jgi:hypothetical protein
MPCEPDGLCVFTSGSAALIADRTPGLEGRGGCRSQPRDSFDGQSGYGNGKRRRVRYALSGSHGD